MAATDCGAGGEGYITVRDADQRNAAIALREALALCCYAKVEHRDRQAFNQALEEPNGGPLDLDTSL